MWPRKGCKPSSRNGARHGESEVCAHCRPAGLAGCAGTARIAGGAGGFCGLPGTGLGADLGGAPGHPRARSGCVAGAAPVRRCVVSCGCFGVHVWRKAMVGTYLVVEAYEIIDPEVYTDAWGDRWLQNYATAKIKYQWASNLSKFTGMTLPGGVQFNAQQLLNDSENEIRTMEREMISGFSAPILDLIG